MVFCHFDNWRLCELKRYNKLVYINDHTATNTYIYIYMSHLQAILGTDLQHPGRKLKDYPHILHSCVCAGLQE